MITYQKDALATMIKEEYNGLYKNSVIRFCEYKTPGSETKKNCIIKDGCAVYVIYDKCFIDTSDLSRDCRNFDPSKLFEAATEDALIASERIIDTSSAKKKTLVKIIIKETNEEVFIKEDYIKYIDIDLPEINVKAKNSYSPVVFYFYDAPLAAILPIIRK